MAENPAPELSPISIDPLFSLIVVARYLDTTIRGVRYRIDTGRLPAVKEGTELKVRASDLQTYLAHLPPARIFPPENGLIDLC